ncbi:MAG: sigma-70 family RNA polymerase sigma factor [Lachnospiraceae bacterium]|nr:sigma-70 family RNA polymerase sigma factor [Lachnospiraceae bacterium]
MKKEINSINVTTTINVTADTVAITADTYAGMTDEERVSFNKTVSLNEELALRDVRKLIGSTRGKKIMTVKGLRRIGVLVAARNLHDCRMEVYSNGFAAYRNGDHEAVLRMEYVGKEKYDGDSEVGIKDKTYSLEDYGWGNAVMFCGEERIEDEYADKYKKRLAPTAGNAHCDEDGEEGEDMELNAGVDIEADYEREEEKERNLSKLTDKQRRVVEMYVFEHKTQQEIADELHISQSTVKNHIEAALKKLEK